VLERTFHQQEVTARLFSELPTGGSYNAQRIWEAYKRVYGFWPWRIEPTGMAGGHLALF